MRAIIENESAATHLVFLGDICDSCQPQSQIAGIRETAEFYRNLIERPNTTVLLGNHDCPVRESFSLNRHFKKKIPLIHQCSGFTNNKSIEFNKAMTQEHWNRVQLFTVANGVLLSHAGLHESFWRPFLGVEENLGALWKDAQQALDLLPFQMHPLLDCGKVRGGYAENGGLTWQDILEFEDKLPLSQIFGHSNYHCPRRIDRSYCIDANQTSYALIEKDGNIRIKSANREKIEWVFHEVEPEDYWLV